MLEGIGLKGYWLGGSFEGLRLFFGLVLSCSS